MHDDYVSSFKPFAGLYLVTDAQHFAGCHRAPCPAMSEGIVVRKKSGHYDLVASIF